MVVFIYLHGTENDTVSMMKTVTPGSFESV